MEHIILAKLENNTKALYPPFGILYLTNSLEKAGYNVTVFHEIGNRKNIQRLLETIKKRDILFVGFSTITGPQLIPTIKASEFIKRQTYNIPVVWGGIHSTILGRQCLAEDFVDIVVVGEGEETTVELANALRDKKNLGQISSLGYKENGDIRINETRSFIDLDYYSCSWRSVNLDRYFKKKWGFKRVLPILLSRGCPHRCSFCYNSIVNKTTYRAPSLGKSIQELERLKRDYAVEGVMFYDDSFFVDNNRALEIIRRIDLPWFSEIRADYVNEFLIKEIVRHKCQGIYIGAESGSQRVLDMIQKDIKVHDIIKSVQLCKKYNLDLTLSFMTGIPGEEEEDIRKTMDFIDSLAKIYQKINIEFKIYTPYPGTPLWERALEYGLKEPQRTIDWASYQRNICNLPWIENPTKLEKMCYACSLVYSKIGIANNLKLKDILKVILKYIQKIRWKNRFFNFPIEHRLIFFIKSLREYG